MTKDKSEYSAKQGHSEIVEYQDYNGEWRKRLMMSQTNFTEAKKGEFLLNFAETGRMEQSAQMVGTTSKTVREHMKSDLAFAEAVEVARSIYNDKRRKVVDELFFNPPVKKTYDRNGDLIAEENLYMQNFIIKYMAAHCEEWRDKSEVSVTHNAGVMLIPSQMSSADEWEKKFGKSDTSSLENKGDILDITYTDIDQKTPSPDGKSD